MAGQKGSELDNPLRTPHSLSMIRLSNFEGMMTAAGKAMSHGHTNEWQSGARRTLFSRARQRREQLPRNRTTTGVLADADPAWRPAELRDELLGTELTVRFSTAKLLDYEADMAALEGEANPFALVVLAHAGMRATVADPHARPDWKFGLTRRLFERGYTRQ